MIVNPESVVYSLAALASIGVMVYFFVKTRKKSPPDIEGKNFDFPPPPPPSLSSRINELGRLFNVLFDYVGSRTVFIGKLVLIFNDKGVSVRVQDPRLPAPNMEIAFFDEEEQYMHFYLNDTSLEKQNKIVDWVRKQVEAEIEKRKAELEYALTVIASITEEGPEAEPQSTME